MQLLTELGEVNLLLHESRELGGVASGFHLVLVEHDGQHTRHKGTGLLGFLQRREEGIGEEAEVAYNRKA